MDDSKTDLPVTEDMRTFSNRSRRRPRFALAAVAILMLYLVLTAHPMSYAKRLMSCHSTSSQADAPTADRWAHHHHDAPVDPSQHAPAPASPAAAVVADRSPVPLEAHIMSKCPDAQDCLRDMVLPAMMRVYEKVNFTLSFIGAPTENDGVDCRHGPAECMGNIIELCAAQLYPDPKIYLGFTMCLTREYDHIPQRELVEDCALEHAISIEKLDECASRDDGAYGIGLLRDSVRKTSAAGVTKSCTVRLNNDIYCIRDDGEWVDCPSGPGVSDLVIAVEKLYRQQ